MPETQWTYEELLAEYERVKEANAQLAAIIARCQQIIDDYMTRKRR